MKNRKAFYFDMLERALWTFVQAAAGTWVGDAITDVSLPWRSKLAIATGAGGIAVVKSFMAAQMPWTAVDSASTLPASVDPPQVEEVEIKRPAARKK